MFTAASSGARHVCAYLYPQQIGPGDSLAPIATADAAFRVLPGGGHGQLAINGQVGPLRLDSSTFADVVAFAGPPDVQTSGTFGTVYYPRYRALGYSCQSQDGSGLSFVSAHAYCQTAFFINQRTQKLVAFTTSSRAYSGPGGIEPGMPAGQAERQTHRQAITGCLSGLFFGNAFGRRRTPPAWMFVDVVGGRSVVRRSHRRTISVILGGHLGGFSIESTRHPVGLLFC